MKGFLFYSGTAGAENSAAQKDHYVMYKKAGVWRQIRVLWNLLLSRWKTLA